VQNHCPKLGSLNRGNFQLFASRNSSRVPELIRAVEAGPKEYLLGIYIRKQQPGQMPLVHATDFFVYQSQVLNGAARKTMGAEAPLQKPCASHWGSSADWSALASTKVLLIPKAQNCSPSAKRKLKFFPVRDTNCSAIEMQVWVTLSCKAQGASWKPAELGPPSKIRSHGGKVSF
jgi:hypothetical protein